MVRRASKLSRSLAILQTLSDSAQLNPALADICSLYAIDHMTLLVARAGSLQKPYAYFCTTYPKAWQTRYVEKDYFEIDPVIDVISAGLLPVDWASLDRSGGGVAFFFDEALSLGLGPQGLSVPIRGPGGERSLFSVASRSLGRRWAQHHVLNSHDFQILAYHVHEKVLALSGLRSTPRNRRLSRREQQCLELVGRGRIPKQIAAQLLLSESAVRLYLRSARDKLGASTSHHAVARASMLELIQV